jgi:hypothetical protein
MSTMRRVRQELRTSAAVCVTSGENGLRHANEATGLAPERHHANMDGSR